jgi:thiamine-monophosphate kinase
MRESELLAHIYRRSEDLPARWPNVVVGPGDDCAVVRAPSGSLLLVTVDQLVRGRHFVAQTPVELIARKIVARSVSDIAAMGGAPAWGLATAAMPRDYPEADALFDAMSRWAEQFQCPLVGGDIATTIGDELVLTLTVAGTPHPVRGPVLRSGACEGDEVWVTGKLGGSLGSGRHLRFDPRLTEGAWLCDLLGEKLHAMIDVSDGLGRDAGRVAEASKVGIEIEATAVPRQEGVERWRVAVSEGEDYELCFTVASGAGVPWICDKTGVPLTRVGRVTAGTGCTVIDERGQGVDASEMGWDHGGEA